MYAELQLGDRQSRVRGGPASNVGAVPTSKHDSNAAFFRAVGPVPEVVRPGARNEQFVNNALSGALLRGRTGNILFLFIYLFLSLKAGRSVHRKDLTDSFGLVEASAELGEATMLLMSENTVFFGDNTIRSVGSASGIPKARTISMISLGGDSWKDTRE